MEKLGTVELVGERLVLRRVIKEDCASLVNGVLNDEEFLYYASKKKITLEEQMQKMETIINNYSDPLYFNWAITLKQGDVIGLTHFRVIDKNDSVEFSYAISKAYTGNGYMTEALSLLIDFALNKLKVNRIQGACVVSNIASYKVMEKCGMEKEGLLRKYIRLADGYHDAYMFSKTRNN